MMNELGRRWLWNSMGGPAKNLKMEEEDIDYISTFGQVTSLEW